jgi:hypothetical protein
VTLTLVAVGAALVAAGCGDGNDDQAPVTASAGAEAVWTDEVLGWIENFTAAGTYEDCRQLFTSIVGPPPSRSLEAIADVAQDMCGDFARWRAGQAKALRTDDRDTYVRAQAQLDAAESKLRELARLAVEHVPGTTEPTLPRLAELTDRSREEPTLAAVAAELSGKSGVVVRCWSPRDWARVSRAYAHRNGVTFGLGGFASPYARSIDLSADVCSALARIRYGHGDHVPEEAFALNVLAHESMHLLAEDPSEAKAECYAMQRIVRVGTILGMPADVARRRATYYFENLYPGQYPEYRSPDCRPNGPLDQSPGGSWP